MTKYSRGDVVLVSFVFADETGAKQRPAVIISAITSRINRILVGDHPINHWREAGLLFPSVATGIIRTIKQSTIVRKLGKMPEGDLKEIDEQLSTALGIA